MGRRTQALLTLPLTSEKILTIGSAAPALWIAEQGFPITLVKPDRSDALSASEIEAALRPDTLLVSVRHVNNETGVKQPLHRRSKVTKLISMWMPPRDFGKNIDALRELRIDLISASSHKIYGRMAPAQALPATANH